MPIITLRPSLGSLRKRQASKSKMALVADLVRHLSLRELVTISKVMVLLSRCRKSGE